MALDANPYITQTAYAAAAGEVIAYPTEAVWGLGCDPFCEPAVQKILRLKRRPQAKGVILIAGSMAQVEFLLHDLDLKYRERLMQTWPGPNTWLVPHHCRVPESIHGRFDTVAVRVTEHPVVKSLCETIGGPLVSTSANPQGLPPAQTQLRARSYFGQAIHYCPGVVGNAVNPSQIRHLLTGDVIRPA